MMMSFCKNTLHAFLGISNRDILQPPSTTASSSSTGLNSITGDCRKPSNILESASLKSSLKKGGSLDEITSGGGSSVSTGLSSCTESLGLESSEQMEEATINTTRSRSPLRRRAKKPRIREEVKKFPPPISSMRRNQGDCSSSTSFLKPVRENGRLILTEVTINRPEVFHTCRENGRLRLQFVHENSERIPRQQEAEDEKTQAKTPVTNGGGKNSWWCHEEVHHHHRQQLWNLQCVTSQ